MTKKRYNKKSPKKAKVDEQIDGPVLSDEYIVQKIKRWILSNKTLMAIFIFSLIVKMVPILYIDHYVLNSDGAVAAFVGKHFLEGQFPLFIYSTTYGGGLEYLMQVVFFWVFGTTTTAHLLSSATIVFFCELLFYLLLLNVSPNASKRNFMLFLFIIISSTFTGFFEVSYLPHLNTIFFAVSLGYLTVNSKSWFDKPIAKGLIIGLGFWVSNVIILVIIPVIIIKFLKKLQFKKEFLKAATFVIFATLGAFPRIYYLLNKDKWYVSVNTSSYKLASLQHIINKTWENLSSTFPTYFFKQLHSNAIFYVGYLIIITCIVIYTVRVIKDTLAKKDGYEAPLFFLIIFYLINGAMVSHARVHDSGIRYLFLTQFFSAMACSDILWPFTKSSLKKLSAINILKLVSLSIIIVLCLISQIVRINDTDKAHAIKYTDTKALITILDKKQCRVGWGDFWVAYEISWFTQERIKLAPIYSTRILAYNKEVIKNKKRCYIFDLRKKTDRRTMLNQRVLNKFAQYWKQTNAKIMQTKYKNYSIFFENFN
ncbi:hypothetical protein ISS03_03480 [Patescibacteria group bacterium]|nr:hypothetical protein [Patescibacteria group bacterium]